MIMIKQLTVIIINIDEEDSEGLIIIPRKGERSFYWKIMMEVLFGNKRFKNQSEYNIILSANFIFV